VAAYQGVPHQNPLRIKLVDDRDNEHGQDGEMKWNYFSFFFCENELNNSRYEKSRQIWHHS